MDLIRKEFGQKSGGIDSSAVSGFKDGCPLEISRSFLAGAHEQSLFILHKPLHRVVDQGFSGHTAGRITPELSRSHCTTQKAAIRQISLNLIVHNCTFSKNVLDTFGNDGFRGKQDVAMVRFPRNRTGLLIGFTAIIATVLVQGPGCNLIGQRRNENGNSTVGRSRFGNSLPQIIKKLHRLYVEAHCSYISSCPLNLPMLGPMHG
jgi:hypothetical protein